MFWGRDSKSGEGRGDGGGLGWGRGVERGGRALPADGIETGTAAAPLSLLVWPLRKLPFQSPLDTLNTLCE